MLITHKNSASFALKSTRNQSVPPHAGDIESKDFYKPNSDSHWQYDSGEFAGRTTHEFMLRYNTAQEGPERVTFTKMVENPDKPLTKKQRLTNGIKGGFQALADSAASPFLVVGAPAALLAGIQHSPLLGLGIYGALLGISTITAGAEVVDGAREGYAQKAVKEPVSVSGMAAAMKDDLVFRPDNSDSIVNLGPDPRGGWISGDGI